MTQVLTYPTKKMGRPSAKPSKAELYMLYSGMTRKQVAEHYGVAVSTVARWLHEYKTEE